MSSAPTTSSDSSPEPTDRDRARARYYSSAAWRDNLNRRYTHQVLGVPEDDVIDGHSEDNRVFHGLPAWAAVAITTVALAGGAALGSLWFGRGPSAAPAQIKDPPPAKAKIELYYDDPEEGLVPLGGAAERQGAEVP